METKIFHDIQTIINNGFNNKPSLKKNFKIKSTNVDYKDLENELLRLMNLTKNNLFIDDKYHSFFIYGLTGSGKCFAPRTPILMFDGSIKNVENIKINDLLMGPDSKQRKVVSTCSGEEMMYDIIPTKGEKYTVNESHILSLKMTNDASYNKLKKNEYVNISIKDYLNKNNWFKHKAKGWRSSVEWKKKKVSIDPYFLGLWLGDGNSNHSTKTNIDKEIINFLYEFTKNFKNLSVTKDKNILLENLRDLDLINNKHIPMIYKINDREIRLKVLAGLLDSDGHYRNGGFEISQKRKQLAYDILFLARSLGLAAYCKKEKKSAHKDHSDWYYRISISGDCSVIPTKIKRKQAEVRKQKKNVLVTGIKVKQVGIGKYCGFTLEGPDKLFLLGDFSVVHNTEIVEKLAKQENFIYHKLEIQKVPIEILQGFPYLKDIKTKKRIDKEIRNLSEDEYITKRLTEVKEEYDKKFPLEELLHPALYNEKFSYTLIENIKKEYSDKIKNSIKIIDQKVAKLAPSTILPPSEDDRCWVLHFDEFNKADTDKMAAVMNLILTGELGGSADFDGENSIKYKLPRRTVIIGTGNTKCQEAVQNLNVVSSMDIATSERWHRSCFLDYNVKSWFENFAIKPFKFKNENLDTRIVPIILNFILDKTLDTGDNKAAFLIPIISGSEEGNEAERTTSPRSWTIVSDNMILDGYNDWKKEKFNVDNLSFNDYIKNPENQINLLIKQVYEFGLNGKQIVNEIISRYIYFAENRILPDDILLNYKDVRKRIKELKDKKGIILYLLLGVGYYIDLYTDQYDLENSAINISTFIEDTDISVEDLVAFIQTIEYSNNLNSKKIHNLLFNISKRYQNAYGGYYYTSEKEIK